MLEKPEQGEEKTENSTDNEKPSNAQARFLPLAIEQCSEGVAMVDLDGNVQYLNDAFARMHGYSPAELIGKHLSIFHTPEQIPFVDAANRQTKETGKFRGEIWHARRDGSVFPGMMHNSLIRNEEGNPAYIIGLLRNITQRKQLEEALRKSEEKYRLLADNIIDVILVIDVDRFVIRYISPSAESVFGYTPAAESVFGYTQEELANLNAFDFLTPPSANHMMAVFKQEMEKEKSGKAEVQRLELEILHKEGSTTWIGVSARFLRDNSRKVKSILCVVQDITKRKKAEEALRKSEEQYRLLAENVKDIIAVVDLDRFVFSYISPSAEAVFGYTQEELANINAFNLLTPHSADLMMTVLNQEVEKNKFGKAEAQWLELQVLCKDNSTAWMEVSACFLRDNKNQITGVLCVIRDISKRREAEEALRKSEDRYRHLVEKMSDGLAVQNENGQLVFVNNRFCEIVGYRHDALIGKPIVDFLDDRNRQIVKDQMSNRRQGAPAESYEIELLRKDGSKISVNLSPRDVCDSEGKYKGSFAVFTDITLYKEAKEILYQAKDELEKKIRQRTDELEERNIALKVLLSQRDRDKKKLEETIMSNIKTLIEPNLTRLKNSRTDRRQKATIKILESNLNEIISPFLNRRSLTYLKLTPTEIQVANFLKHGATTKEIAKSLDLSQRTIDTHRFNIRKKIGIKGKRINLRTYLSSL
ncbi:MAG: PAS domain S-box protein [Desulfobacterales bacterium]